MGTSLGLRIGIGLTMGTSFGFGKRPLNFTSSLGIDFISGIGFGVGLMEIDFGTVVIRSPKGARSSVFCDRSPKYSSNYSSFDDASTSGIVVLRGQHDELVLHDH
ncbi:hypothetical protein ACSQ67_025204 [Phaseolus vulgaris]